MPKTRQTIAAQRSVMDELQEELGDQNAALVKVLELTMAKYFSEADEKSEARFNRLEKRIDTMHATLSRHTEDIRTIRGETLSLKERTANVEKSTALCLKNLQTYEAKLIELEDRARRDNLLVFNLQEGIEGSNARAYLMEKITEWFPALAPSPPELMRCHRLGKAPSSGSTKGRPRPLIAKCLRFTDRDRLLNEARKSPPEVDGNLLTFTADYSEATTKRRKPCYKLMYEARSHGFQAFLLYPATIKLSRGEDIHIFPELSEAEQFVASLKNN